MNLALLGAPLILALAALPWGRVDPLRAASAGAALAVLAALLAVAAGAATDTAQAVMMVLVTGLSAVIARYSATFLRGEPVAPRYARWFLATAGAVTLAVAAEHLAAFALAWTGTSLALHQLLLLYPERPAAQVAAHKKFLVSRLADLCMLLATLLLWRAAGDLELAALARWSAEPGPLPWSGQAGVLLLVVAVMLRSAQLPFHGWLLQVMEAPTPVSALLHAGIVNIGGYLLLRLAPLLAEAPLALAMLVGVGTMTAVIAALVRLTRVSVKVALAWSTCAQMGFLLLECGLGAWSLALLHLVAHALYKAHAFLGAGGTVEAWRVDALGARPGPVPLAAFARAGAAVLLVVAPALLLLEDAGARGFAIILALALIPPLARATLAGPGAARAVLARALLVAAITAGWHLLLPAERAPAPALWLVAIAGFALLFAAQVALASAPRGRLARALQPALFAGLYLDELFTRLTFRLWPPAPVRS